jgi:hypothetical protein
MGGMLEPLPETAEALAEFLSFEDPKVDEAFVGMGEKARTIVPELVGLSLTLVQEGVTFTLAAPGLGVASLDAMQYLDDGPCERSVEQVEPIIAEVQDLLDEACGTSTHGPQQLWVSRAACPCRSSTTAKSEAGSTSTPPHPMPSPTGRIAWLTRSVRPQSTQSRTLTSRSPLGSRRYAHLDSCVRPTE